MGIKDNPYMIVCGKVPNLDFHICHRLTTVSRFFVAREGLNMVFCKKFKERVGADFFTT